MYRRDKQGQFTPIENASFAVPFPEFEHHRGSIGWMVKYVLANDQGVPIGDFTLAPGSRYLRREVGGSVVWDPSKATESEVRRALEKVLGVALKRWCRITWEWTAI
jgi:hypothetical protein